MGSSAGREMVQPTAVNTPMIGLCAFAGVFNSMERGQFRVSNAYTSIALMMIFGFSTGFTEVLNDPVRGAQLGTLGASVFLAGRPLRILYTNRLMSPLVHNGVGSFYLAYHMLSWYRSKYAFEDALEDVGEEEKVVVLLLPMRSTRDDLQTI
eukprot:gene1593-970_t